jgi:hypothetical protein
MSYLNTQIDTYFQQRPFKEHELEMLNIIKSDNKCFEVGRLKMALSA